MTRSRLCVLALLCAAGAAPGCGESEGDAITVVFSLPSQSAAFAKATVVADYSRAGARILEESGGPACAFILPGVDGSFSDDRRGSLTVRLSSKRGLRGPADVVACRMRAASDDATPDSLREHVDIRLTEAEDAGGKALDVAALARPAVAGSAPVGASPVASGKTDAGAGEKGKERKSNPGVVKPGAAAASATKSEAKPAGPPAPPKPAAAPAASASQPKAATAPTAAKPTPAAGTGGAVLATPNYGGSTGSAPVPSDPLVPNYDSDPNYDDSPGDDDSAPEYDIVVSVKTAVGPLGALQLDISHTGSAGGFVGKGAGVDCEPLVDGLPAANYIAGRTVRVGLVSIQGIRTPGPVVACAFRTPEILTPSSFYIRVADAADIDTNSVNPPPVVIVSDVRRR